MDSDRTLLDSLTDGIGQVNTLQKPFLEKSLQDIRDSEIEFLVSYLRYCLGTGLSIAFLAECYDLIVRDTLREQMFFMRHGRYRHSTYAEVADSVYMNDSYMRMYMHGLALTSILWPNHRAIYRFFTESIPKDRTGRYLEVGPGHGIYFATAMNHTSYSWFDGIDISPTSVEMTRAVLESGTYGTSESFSISCGDFLSVEPAGSGYDAVVMGEVLEHVEQPRAFLEGIATHSGEGAYIFITTAINAPAVDHIHLFDTPESVFSLARAAGLKVREHLLIPYTGLTLDEALEGKMPINIALVLGR